MINNLNESTSNNIYSLPLLDLQDQFFQDLKRKGRSLNTLKNYRTDLHCFNQYLGEKNLKINVENLTVSFVENYGQYLETKYTSDNSRRRRVQALRLFFDFLVEKQILSSNPVRKIPTSPKFLDIPKPTNLTELKTVWQYLLEESHQSNSMTRLLAKRNQVMILLIYSGALKVSDLSHLKAQHIILSKSEDETPKVLITPPKRDPYTIPLNEVFTPVFQDYLEALQKQKNQQNSEFSEILFNANPYRILSGGLSSRGIEIIFEEWRKKLMINMTAKSLRQTCIMNWLQQKKEDGLVKEWMGVAPSYGLKLYKDHLGNNVFDATFLVEMFNHYKNKNHY